MMTETKTNDTLADLEAFRDGLREWVAKVRPPDGSRGRFCWAAETTRGPNVAATRYMVDGLLQANLLEEVWTARDRSACGQWLAEMRSVETGGFRDPALFERRSPDWPEDRSWPSASMVETVNQYAGDLALYADFEEGLAGPRGRPAEGWPQPEDAPESMLQWLRDRPFATRPWAAGSHAMRMLQYLLQWEAEGRVSFDLLEQAFRLVYAEQDPGTGLWGGTKASRYERINGTFKLLSLLREMLRLPLPHADRLIDQILGEMDRPDYDATVAGCDELDNWYVLAQALEPAGGHRREEIRERAARRIGRILELYRSPDGGLSYRPATCQTAWIGFDMAPEVKQGDAMGLHILGRAISICLALGGLGDRAAWRSGTNIMNTTSIQRVDAGAMERASRRLAEALGGGADRADA